MLTSLFVLLALAGQPCGLCLYGPDNMIVDDAGSIFLTDSDRKTHLRILRLAPDGTRIAEWRIFTVAPGDHNGPEGIALNRAGHVLVTDAGSASVLEVSRQGKVLGYFGGRARFHNLGHVAVDATGNVYISQAAPNLIEKFSPAGRLIARWHRAKGGDIDRWGGPETIAVQNGRNVVVEDWPNHRIEILSPAGTTLHEFGRAGTGRGEFVNSAGLAVDRAGNIYVADIALHRVQKFDARGHFLAQIPNAPRDKLFMDGPGAVAVDAQGNLYSPDGLTIVKYSQRGALLARYR